MKLFSLILLVFSFYYTASSQPMDAQAIVDKCIEVHGGKAYADTHFGFTFRDKQYELQYDHGQYQYVRSYKDKKGLQIKDVLTNQSFTRTINGKQANLTDKEIKSYSSSVNSVNYFVYLPYFLNDLAVRKKLLGKEEIKGDVYHKIQVTFAQEGGGEDYDDVYVYWIHADRYTMDYLAYSYIEDDGGVRFRAAYNQREVGGLRWQDYYNYKADSDTSPSDMAELYTSDGLKLLSKIDSEQVVRIR